ncbi:DNA phosphorothioation system restriction enzyme [Staphylococcus gallinarum]|uniref:DNA phosphorothioation system restriction enzyme n=1 Tax=Staphylococcus gallinarum TaxID=1293 RepID=A0A380F9H3_STAGA|nr:DNA phosphorothioation system restriction enzyme [Staphylococcus gallinarum]
MIFPFQYKIIKQRKKWKKKLILENIKKKQFNAWEKSGNKGILEMATGTGKTITSLLAAREYVKKKISMCISDHCSISNTW